MCDKCHRYGEGSELYQRRKRQVLGVFDVLELDNNGCLPIGHQVEMLTQLLGHEDNSKDMAMLIARELDADNDGVITFDELFDWFAMHEVATSDPVRQHCRCATYFFTAALNTCACSRTHAITSAPLAVPRLLGLSRTPRRT